MNNEVIGIATFEAINGKSEELKVALSTIIFPTRNEEGCLSYILIEDINNPNIFTMLERFKDKASFDSHTNQPYITNFRNIRSSMVKTQSFSLCKQIG